MSSLDLAPGRRRERRPVGRRRRGDRGYFRQSDSALSGWILKGAVVLRLSVRLVVVLLETSCCSVRGS